MTTSFYVGPDRPPLLVTSWADLVAAAQAGALAETQWVELKAALPPAAKPANLELARDLASLSADGGTLVIGVRDPGDAIEHVTGTSDEIEALKDRVAQIAISTRIQPPLNVQLTVLPHPSEPGQHVLLVAVPASPEAPHMVDDRYWGRSANGKRPLGNVETSRLWSARRGARQDFEQRVRSRPEELDRLWPAVRQLGWAHVLVEPSVAPMTRRLDENPALPLQMVLGSASFRPQWSPSLESLRYVLSHPDGSAWTSFNLESDTAEFIDQYGLYLLITDNGTVRLIGPSTCFYGHDRQLRCISANYLMELVHQGLELAARLGTDHLAYAGAWKVGVHLEGLAGHLSAQALGNNLGFRTTPFPTDSYTRTTTVHGNDLTSGTAAIVEAVLRDLARGLGLKAYLFPYKHPSEILQKR